MDLIMRSTQSSNESRNMINELMPSRTYEITKKGVNFIILSFAHKNKDCDQYVRCYPSRLCLVSFFLLPFVVDTTCVYVSLYAPRLSSSPKMICFDLIGYVDDEFHILLSDALNCCLGGRGWQLVHLQIKLSMTKSIRYLLTCLISREIYG